MRLIGTRISKNHEYLVFDNGYTSCHINVIDSNNTSAQSQKMHAHYKKLLGSDKELKCVSCLYIMQDIALTLEITLNAKSQHIKFMRRVC
ncbi:hypothetical protein [Campylobacter concisus]|uniref:hypothetical protein n=1 Tax=Campylobacter concisus TaxID=199 RepID=UPI002A2408CD|nr:hypothetical protein [Campylobacter concisus]